MPARVPAYAVRAALVLVVALLAGSLGGRIPVAVAQGAGAGIVDDETYESPLYGYAVTWEAPWAADPAQTLSGVGASDSDLLTLGERGGDGAIRVEGFVDESGLDDPLADRAYVAALFDAITAALDTTCVPPACTATVIEANPDASPPTLTYELEVAAGVIRAITALATAETDAGLLFAETLLTRPEDVETTLEDVQATIAVAGRPALEGVSLRDGVPVDEAGGRGTPVGSPVATPALGAGGLSGLAANGVARR